MLLGNEIRVTHSPDPNKPSNWMVRSSGQIISSHRKKSAAKRKAKKKGRNSSGAVEVVIETKDGKIQSQTEYEGTNQDMPGLDDINIL